jgi:MFS family permease
MKVYAGALSDRFSRRRPLVVAGYAISNVAQPLIGLARSWPWVLPLRFFDRLGKGVRTAPRDAIIADSVDDGVRGWAYGFHRAMDSAGGVLGPLLAFAILAWLAARRGIDGGALLGESAGMLAGDYRWVILAAAVPNAIAVGLMFLVKERPRHAPPAGSVDLHPPTGAFRLLLVAVALFGLGNLSYSFIVLRAGQLGVSAMILPLLYLFFHLGQTVFSGPLGALSDRYGRKAVIGAGYATFALMCAGWATAYAPWHAAALSALYGFSLACTEGTIRAFGVDLVPKARRGSALGSLNGIAGLAALPASLIAGLLWDRAGGAPAAFAWGAVLATAGTVVLTLVPATAPPSPAASAHNS